MKSPAISGSILILSTCSLFVLEGCNNKSDNDIKSLKWMLGTWKSPTEEGILYEEWNSLNDSTYIGHAYAISPEGDTTFSENAEIGYMNGLLTYSVTVNDAETTDFTLVDNQGQAVFENVNHDFPQRIIYKKLAKDSLFARIEGTVDGEEQFEEYRYGK